MLHPGSSRVWGRFPGLKSDEFDPITKRVVDIRSPLRGTVILANGGAVLAQSLQQRVIIGASERGMSFSGRSKIFFDAEMDLYVAAREPAAAAIVCIGRLGDLGHTE